LSAGQRHCSVGHVPTDGPPISGPTHLSPSCAVTEPHVLAVFSPIPRQPLFHARVAIEPLPPTPMCSTVGCRPRRSVVHFFWSRLTQSRVSPAPAACHHLATVTTTLLPRLDKGSPYKATAQMTHLLKLLARARPLGGRHAYSARSPLADIAVLHRATHQSPEQAHPNRPIQAQL
jgi:hypothetical protein